MAPAANPEVQPRVVVPVKVTFFSVPAMHCFFTLHEIEPPVAVSEGTGEPPVIEPDSVSVGGLLFGTPVDVEVSVLVPVAPFHLMLPVVVTELLPPRLHVAGPDPEFVTFPPVIPKVLDVQ